MTPEDSAELVFEFGPFQLVPMRRLLTREGSPVALGGRSMDLLIALLERAGQLLGRAELESRVWPTTVVEETSLRVHMSALRRTLQDGRLGARYITNVPGRGYCFVGAVTRSRASSPSTVDGTAADAPVCLVELSLINEGVRIPALLVLARRDQQVIDAVARLVEDRWRVSGRRVEEL